MARKNYEQEACEAGFADVDGLNGYLAGRRGEYISSIPGHLTGKRADRWHDGYFKGLDSSKAEKGNRRTVVWWRDKDGQSRTAVLKGWGVSRARYCSKLAAQGVGGDVDFAYFEGQTKVRSQLCGI